MSTCCVAGCGSCEQAPPPPVTVCGQLMREVPTVVISRHHNRGRCARPPQATGLPLSMSMRRCSFAGSLRGAWARTCDSCGGVTRPHQGASNPAAEHGRGVRGGRMVPNDDRGDVSVTPRVERACVDRAISQHPHSFIRGGVVWSRGCHEALRDQSGRRDTYSPAQPPHGVRLRGRCVEEKWRQLMRKRLCWVLTVPWCCGVGRTGEHGWRRGGVSE